MFYCKAGNILVVNALYNKDMEYLYGRLPIKPYVYVLVADGSGVVERIPHGDLVMALESSVPPWYKEDRIRCLWKEKEVHILRVALDYHDRNYHNPTEDPTEGSV